MESVFDEIPKALFPAEYGGEAGSTEDLGKDLAKRLESYAKFFEDDENYGVDESQRLSKSVDLYGTVGTFRKFTFD